MTRSQRARYFLMGAVIAVFGVLLGVSMWILWVTR